MCPPGRVRPCANIRISQAVAVYPITDIAGVSHKLILSNVGGGRESGLGVDFSTFFTSVCELERVDPPKCAGPLARDIVHTCNLDSFAVTGG